MLLAGKGCVEGVASQAEDDGFAFEASSASGLAEDVPVAIIAAAHGHGSAIDCVGGIECHVLAKTEDIIAELELVCDDNTIY